MGVIAGSKVVELAQAAASYAKESLVRATAGSSEIEVLGSNLLVATYIRPEMTDGGIIRPIENIKEDEYQGKMGLVIGANKEDAADALHKWVLFGCNDGLQMHYNGVHCRIISIDR